MPEFCTEEVTNPLGGCASALVAVPELLTLARIGMLNFSVWEMMEKVSSTEPEASRGLVARLCYKEKSRQSATVNITRSEQRKIQREGAVPR